MVSDVLIDRIRKVLKERNRKIIVIAGGVSANTYIRSRMDDLKKEGIKVYYPPIKLCTDNAAMIGAAAYYDYKKGMLADLTLNAVPSLKLGQR